MTTAVTSASVTRHPALNPVRREAFPLTAPRAATLVEDISRYRTIDSPLAQHLPPLGALPSRAEGRELAHCHSICCCRRLC